MTYNPNMTPQEIADTCEATAEILEGKWTKGAWHDVEAGTYCIEGALAAALNFEPSAVADDITVRDMLRSCPVYDAVMRTIIEQIIATDDEELVDSSICAIEDDGLPYWNDRDYRTEQEVLDVLHTTAKRVLGVGPDCG